MRGVLLGMGMMLATMAATLFVDRLLDQRATPRQSAAVPEADRHHIQSAGPQPPNGWSARTRSSEPVPSALAETVSEAIDEEVTDDSIADPPTDGEPATSDEFEGEAEAFEREQSLSAQFTAEHVDLAWQDSAEREIVVFFQEASFLGTTLSRSECRTSMCIVELRHDSPHDAAAAQRAMGKGPFRRSTFFRTSEDRTTTTMFVAREGQGLPGISSIPPTSHSSETL